MLTGESIAHYHVLEKLGEGGMGVVYRARDERLNRDVALKVLPEEFSRDPLRRKRFQQEARAAAAVNHANVATVFGIEENGAEFAIVYEFVKGETLRALARRPIEFDVLVEIAVETARALASAHEHGVVHRDIKPENIMRTVDGIKVLDFGLARVSPLHDSDMTMSQALTNEGMAVGTIAYMSPEQLQGKAVDARSDVFSFGALLYELATGIHPFSGDSTASTIARILTSEPPSILTAKPIVPGELDRIVRKCLKKDARERYQSTRDLVIDLEALRQSLHSGSSASVTVPAAATGSAYRKGPVRAAAALQTLLLATNMVSLSMYVRTTIIAFDVPQSPKLAAATLASLAFGVALYLLMLSITVRLWRAQRKDAQHFVRWFSVYAPFNALFTLQVGGVFSWFLTRTGASTLMVMMLPVVVYLPFFQRRLVRSALGEISAEE